MAKSRSSYWGAYALLLVLWALLVTGARALSFSIDEPAHIAAGYLYLARWKEAGWYFLSYLHPPLINVAQALLLFAANPHIPLETLPNWGVHYAIFANSFVPYLTPIEAAEILARAPVMHSTVLLGALLFRWGKDIGGPKAGLVALALMTFDPISLAHGRLATTDMGVTATGTLALYAGWRWLEHPSWRNTFIVGGLAGLTMLAKMSGILWCAAFGLMAVGKIALQWRQQGLVRIVQAATIGLTAMLIIWAVFGFSFGQSSLLPFAVPAPTYWTAFHNLQAEATSRIFIAFGRPWNGAQWWFYPLNFSIKNPLPWLAALLVGGWSYIKQSKTHPRLLRVIVFPCLYLIFSASGGMNISYRHLLPLHPFLHLAIAQGMVAWFGERRGRRWPYLTWGALGVWYILGTLTVFPDELTYYNELVGGAGNGHRYLVDSTQDWGQSFKELRDYLQAHPGPEPQVVYFTPAHPGFYDIPFRSLWPSGGAQEKATPFHPQPGRYVMGVTPLYGLVGPDPQQLNWFRRATPQAMVGHALFVYDVSQQPAWLSQCITPALPLDTAAVLQGFGSAAAGSLRQTNFDCTAAWLYPNGGEQAGIYALHHSLLQEQKPCSSPLLRCDPVPGDPFIARRLAGTRLSYEQQDYSLLPAFALYEREGSRANAPQFAWLQAAPAETPPATLATGSPLTAPVSMAGPLVFLGAARYEEKDGLDIETWWQATQTISRPLSIMAHLLTEQGEPLGVADGFGVSPLTLRAGDIVAQRHRFSTLPAGARETWLRTGIYWLDTLERWNILNAPGSDALFVRFTPPNAARGASR